MRPKKFVGVLGVRNKWDAEKVKTLEGPRDTMLYMGIEPEVSRHTFGEMAKIFLPSQENLLSVLYADLCRVEERELCGRMRQLILLGGPNCNGLQLELELLPPRAVFEAYKKGKNAAGFNSPGHGSALVVYCGQRLLARFGWAPNLVAQVFGQYEGLVDYVLVDPRGDEPYLSGGGFALACAKAFGQHRWLGVGFCGGIDDNNSFVLRRAVEHLEGEASMVVRESVRSSRGTLDVARLKSFFSSTNDL